jgi:3-hydroxyacyl-CoA dehydrogenase
MDRTDNIAIVGAGVIGRAWAVVFANAGFPVAIWDPQPHALEEARGFIQDKLIQLHESGLSGNAPTEKGASESSASESGSSGNAFAAETVQQVYERISFRSTLPECLASAAYVQENGPENLEQRIRLFQELDTLAPGNAVIASSTSGMPPSAFTADLRHRERCLVAHPPNPPYLLPLVELCPAPWTSPAAISRAEDMLRAAGRQVCSLSNDVVSVQDIDAVIKHGLGLRWAFMGPLETVDLNASGGIADFCARYGSLYEGLQYQMPPRDWDEALVGKIAQERRAELPAEDIARRQAWRDGELQALAVHLAQRRKRPQP